MINNQNLPILNQAEPLHVQAEHIRTWIQTLAPNELSVLFEKSAEKNSYEILNTITNSNLFQSINRQIIQRALILSAMNGHEHIIINIITNMHKANLDIKICLFSVFITATLNGYENIATKMTLWPEFATIPIEEFRMSFLAAAADGNKNTIKAIIKLPQAQWLSDNDFRQAFNDAIKHGYLSTGIALIGSGRLENMLTETITYLFAGMAGLLAAANFLEYSSPNT